MNDVYPAEKLRKYPHMLPADVGLWERFLDKYGSRFSNFRYDVHVGGHLERSEWMGDETWAMAQVLAAKRIDAVGYRPREVWIIEVKPESGCGAIGQLVVYSMLFPRSGYVGKRLVRALVCENITPDDRFVMEGLGYEYFIV